MNKVKSTKSKKLYVPIIYPVNDRTSEWKKRSDESMKRILAKYSK